MSGTVALSFRDRMIWARSEAAAVFIACMVEAAEGRPDLDWLADTVQSWRVQACVRDFGMTLDADWTDEQICAVRGLVQAVTDRLRRQGEFSREELNTWSMGDDLLVDGGQWRATYSAAPPLDVADAVDGLLAGTLPPDPPGGWWFVGPPSGRSVIMRRTDPPAWQA